MLQKMIHDRFGMATTYSDRAFISQAGASGDSISVDDLIAIWEAAVDAWNVASAFWEWWFGENGPDPDFGAAARYSHSSNKYGVRVQDGDENSFAEVQVVQIQLR